MLHFRDVVRLLAELPAQFPVERWTMAGVHVWPLVRYEVARANFDLPQREPPSPSGSRLASYGRHLWGAARAVTRGQARALPTRADLLLYSDGVSYEQSAVGGFDRFVDPARAFALDAGLRVLTLTPHGSFLHGADPRPLYLQGYLDAVQVLAALRSRAPWSGAEHMDGFEPAMAALRAQGATVTPAVKALRRIVRQVQVHALALEPLLRVVQPGLALLPSYIGTERMAFVLACRRAGVPCADVQHGAAGETHWAYGGFGRAPPGGYELVPPLFWAWTREDVAAIARWAPGTAHRGVLAGVPAFVAWRRGVVPGAAEARQALAERARGAEREVCFVLSGYELPEVLDDYVAAVARQPGVFAWFRTHPLRRRQQHELRARLDVAGLRERTEVALSSDLPLPAVLERVQGVVLELSSVAFEAALLGVRSLLVSDATGALYRSLVDANLARTVPRAALAEAISVVERGQPYGPTPAQCDAGIAELLSICGAPRRA